MQYRKMPGGKDKISALGFGLMRLPITDDKKIDQIKTLKMLKAAYDKGVNYFDSAWPYHGGESEEIMGKFIKTIDRSRVFLATKLPTWLIKTREDMDTYLNQQLEKIGTNYIDYYLMHSLNGKRWKELKKLGAIDFLEKAKANGKIRHIGFSFHDKFPGFKYIIETLWKKG